MGNVAQPGVDERVAGVLNRHPAVGLAVGVVRADGPATFSTHGLADVASGSPVTEDTAFRVGSITKTFTAIAAVQLAERGLVDLDAPVADHLRTVRLVPDDPRWRPVTLRHLLTHTAGIGEVRRPGDLLRPVFGELVRPGHPVPPLAGYYRRGLRVRAEPGTRWRYTGHGFAVVGQVVEDVTGIPLDTYLRRHVFGPLGMTGTYLSPPGPDDGVATGYALDRTGARPVPAHHQVTAAAGAAVSTPRDMARYLTALLGGGANEHGSVLAPASMAGMFAPHYRPDPRIPGMGLAFFRREAGGHRVVEHGGLVPGFDSQIVLAPDDGVAVLAVTNGTRGGMFWLPTEADALLGAALGLPPEAVRRDVPHRPDVWPELCGRYTLPGPLTDARARGMAGAGVDVVVRGGRLRLRVRTPVPVAWRGFPLHPDDPADPDVFRLDLSGLGLATMRVVFSRGPDGRAESVHVDRGQLLSARRPHRQEDRP
jgi:CubicO group peptidase (beta-lactamase class C family)